ncbi:DUF6221 family protein [Streptomyces bacillaris]|uniref:DUF6221 family protein n=1 Tax=Streptomyces bacillaris TaxID=68179 RepID=UPI0034605D7E
MTDALVAFLKARLDEDEQAARATDDTLGQRNLRWSTRPEGEAFSKVVANGHYDVARKLTPADGAHIAHHDPARTLRDVESKRLLLEQAVTSRHLVTGDHVMDCPLVTEADGASAGHVDLIQGLNDMWLEELGREPVCIDTCGRDARVRRTLELLALPYSDHPGYAEALAGG